MQRPDPLPAPVPKSASLAESPRRGLRGLGHRERGEESGPQHEEGIVVDGFASATSRSCGPLRPTRMRLSSRRRRQW